jgi:hypothetical protein
MTRLVRGDSFLYGCGNVINSAAQDLGNSLKIVSRSIKVLETANGNAGQGSILALPVAGC